MHPQSESLLLRRDVAVWIDHVRQRVFFLTQDPFVWEQVPTSELAAIDALLEGAASDTLDELLGRAHARDLVERLRAKALLRTSYVNEFRGTLVERQVDFFSEAHADPSAAQRRLRDARVLLIGCGGTGQVVLQHLVAAGIEQFRLVDPDRVEVTDLNRQLMSTVADLGEPKVEVARRHLLARNPRAQVETYQRAIMTPDDLATVTDGWRPSIVVCGADTPPMRIQMAIARFGASNDVACMFGAVGIHSGHFGPLLTTARARDAFIAETAAMIDELAGAAARVVAASFGPPNSMIAVHMAFDVIRWLGGVGQPMSLDREVSVRFADMTLSPQRDWTSS